MRPAKAGSLSPWISLGIPLLLSFGCGLGDHGNTAQGGGSASPGADSVGGFEAVDRADVVAGAAALPPDLGTAFCSSDSLAGIPESGSRGIDFDSGDMIPLCDGWVIIADKTNERIEVRNIITGEIDSRHDVTGVPDDLELDLDAKRVYATLPEQNLIASISLIGEETRIAPTNSMPTSITLTDNEILVAANDGAQLRAYDKGTFELLSNSDELEGETIVFNPASDELIVASSSKISLFGYDLDNVDTTNTLTPIDEDPAQGATLALKLSPNFQRVALVNPNGNASYAGPNVINDFESATVDGIFGAWKVDSGPTSAAFSPLNLGDSDYLIASTASDLVIFDIARHAEISRTTPNSNCSSGSFDRVEFSRGGEIALAKKNCGSQRGTEFHWIAPAGGFGDSASTIGVNVAGLATILPSLDSEPLCTVDNLNALTSDSSGSLEIPRSGDIEPLCDGWVFVAERATNRVRLMNVVTEETISEWDLPDLPVEMIVDEVNKFLFVAMPAGGGVSRIDLAGPGLGDLETAEVPGFPASLTVGNANIIWVMGFFEPGTEVRVTDLNALTMAFTEPAKPLEADFSSTTSQIAFDRTNNRLLVSDSTGFARFTLNGGATEFNLTDPGEELFDTFNSEVILASPDMASIAIVDQNAGVVYDFDSDDIGDLGDTFWEVGSMSIISGIAFDAPSTVFGVATTDELILFNADGDHAELDTFTPSNCATDFDTRAAISRGGTIGFYKSGCGAEIGDPETIYWNEF